jgi:hypothetical protein
MERYNGTWEKSGRSLSAAALAGLLGIGIIYFYGQSFLAIIAVFSTRALRDPPNEANSMLEVLARSAEFTKTPLRISLTISQFLLMLLPTLWLVKHWHTPDVRSYLRLRSCPLAQVALAFAAAVLFFPFNVYISGLLTEMLNIPTEFVTIGQQIFTASTGGEFIFLIFVVAVTPAMCEEVLFRGYAQRTFERVLGWKSVLVVGILFGLYHMQPLGLFSLSGLGLIFGFLFFASRSILPGMVAHFTNNFLVVLSLYLSANGQAGPMEAGQVSPALVGISLPCSGAAMYIFYRLSEQARLSPA